MRRLFLPLCLGLLAMAAADPARAFDNLNTMDRYQEEVKRQKLGPALGVDQQTVERLLQIDQRYKPLKEQAKKEALASFQQLQQVMRSPSPPEGQVRAILTQMIKARRESLNLQERQLEEEMAVLTPVQQARYLMFLMGLRKQMAQEALNLRGSPQREAKPLAPPRELPVVRPGP
jgi:hypothetical protein|uniref:Periplasmic heavy metal sensor n=1 Tax=Desulfobacca acetoxidans TaxID=60893 RepID=A0A7C3SJK5_9BACT